VHASVGAIGSLCEREDPRIHENSGSLFGASGEHKRERRSSDSRFFALLLRLLKAVTLTVGGARSEE